MEPAAVEPAAAAVKPPARLPGIRTEQGLIFPGAATGGLEGVCMMVTGWGSKFLPDLPFTLCRNENLGKTDEQKKTFDMLFSSVRALQKCTFRRLNVKG